MSAAFRGTDACKAEVLARLETGLAAGHVLDDTGVWKAPQGSPACYLAQSGDLRDFETLTGLPAALGGLIDQLALYLSNDTPERDTFLRSVVAAIRPGADGIVLSASLLLALHDDTAMVQAAMLGHRDLREESRLAHAELAAGREVPRATWSALRAKAMDQATETDGIAQAICDFVERTAWPLARSRSALSEGLTTVMRLGASLAVQASGWSAQDQQRIDDTLHALEAEAAARGEDQPNYPAILSAREPELEARFRAQLLTYSESFLALSRQWAARLIALAEAAR